MGSFRRVPWRRSLEYQPMVAPGPPDPPTTDALTGLDADSGAAPIVLSPRRPRLVPRTGRDRIR